MKKKIEEKWNNEVKAKHEDLYTSVDLAKLRSGVKGGWGSSSSRSSSSSSRCQMD